MRSLRRQPMEATPERSEPASPASGPAAPAWALAGFERLVADRSRRRLDRERTSAVRARYLSQVHVEAARNGRAPADAAQRREASIVSGGVRTFLIADVRGYTRFTEERGDEAAARLAARFAELVREGVERRGG